MLLQTKNYEELMEEAKILLPRNTPITNMSPGGIALTLLEIMNKQLSAYYNTLSINHALGFLSTAEGEYLDMIGRMMDCPRQENETDDNYRYRISKQVRTTAAANKMAIRLACLSIEGIKDVKMKRWVLGTGSFAVYLIGENPIISDELLEKAQKTIDEVQAFGNRGIAVKPEEVPIELKIRLVFNNKATQDDRRELALNARREVRMYIQNLSIGDNIIINEIIERVMSVDDKIKNMNIYHFNLRNEPALLQDQEIYWDERVVEANKPNAIYVS